jgi:hypothetical protein
MSKYTCEKCNFASDYKSHYTEHLNTKKHLKSISDSIVVSTKENSKSAVLGDDKPPLETTTLDLNTTKLAETSFQCDHCYIYINNKSNYYRHLHKCVIKLNEDKVINIPKDIIKKCIHNLQCPLCKHQCSRQSSLNIHIRNCKGSYSSHKEVKEIIREDEKDKLIQELKEENKKLKEDVKIVALTERLKGSEKLNEVYAENAKNTNQLNLAHSCNYNGLIQTNMRSMTFLEKFMSNAPELKTFIEEYKDPYAFFIDYKEHEEAKNRDTSNSNSKENILYYDEDKMSKDDYIVEHILFLQKTKKTVNFITERLVHFYKKEHEPVKQSIWNVDIYRYNFTVSLKSGTKTIWHSDKQGHTTAEIIITPLLQFICKILEKHIKKLQKNMKQLAKEMKTSIIVNSAKNIEHLTDFIMSVKNNELQQEIIKRMSPLFSLDVKKQHNLLTNDEIIED